MANLHKMHVQNNAMICIQMALPYRNSLLENVSLLKIGELFFIVFFKVVSFGDNVHAISKPVSG